MDRSIVAALSPENPFLVLEDDDVVSFDSNSYVVPMTTGMFVEVDEFECRDASCRPPTSGGTGGSSKAKTVGVVLPNTKVKGSDPHSRTRTMGRESASDKFWDETMVESAQRSGLAPNARTGDEVVEHFADNIDRMYRVMDQHGNAITRDIIDKSEHWYPAAGKLAEERGAQHGLRRETSVAILAAISPGHDWDSNIQEHAIVLNVVSKNQPINAAVVGPVLKSILEGQLAAAKTDKQKENSQNKLADLEALLARTDGKPFNSLSVDDRARLLKAHAIATGEDFGKQKWSLDADGNAFPDGQRYTLDGSVQKINFQSESTWAKIFKVMDADAEGGPALDQAISEALGAGAKVRSFNNNIGDPTLDDVTIDTHATSVVAGRRVAQTSPEYTEMAGGLSGDGDGLKGPYVAAAVAYRQVAAERGVAPRAAQSQTWVAQKGINDALDGSPTTESIRKTLSNPKKVSKLPPEAVDYLTKELAIRDAWMDMVNKAREAGKPL